ncbi:MAG: hypothetical protein M1838_003418 [Thelocarpon superellum]|nr:MAG: hypothetical protein M1838_003418 [Thelocarpon superellum]
MDMQVDPRLRAHPPPPPLPPLAPPPLSSSLSSSVPISAGPGSRLSQEYSHLPRLPRPSLAENPVRLPPPTPSSVPSLSDAAYHQLTPTSDVGHATVPSPLDSAHDPKRPRACESCRGLKVRCDTDRTNPDGPCRRCAKAGRACVVTVPSRKRQKKSDSRVAELEKKIDALTATLHASHPTVVRAESESDADSSAEDEDVEGGDRGRRPARPNPVPFPSSPATYASQVPETNGWHKRPSPEHLSPAVSAPAAPNADLSRKRKFSDMTAVSLAHEPEPPRANRTAHPSTVASSERPPTATTNGRPSVYPFLMPKPSRTNSSSVQTPDGTRSPPSLSNGTEYVDVIDRRILSAEAAAIIFQNYVDNMTQFFPAVVFPPGTAAAEIRKAKPMLFLSLLSIACGPSHPEIQSTLSKENMKLLAERIICNGEKSLELVQALHLSTLWYWPPDHHEELKFYQFIHIAAVMAVDLGFNRKAVPNRKKPNRVIAAMWRNHHAMRRCTLADANSIEARRSWLSCYFLSSTAALSLRRINLIRWTSYMDDCLNVLQSSPDALPSDRLLCQWVRMQHIADEVGFQFSMDDPAGNLSLSDSKTQYALKGFERQLEDWHAHLPAELATPTIQLHAHVVNLYTHEVAIHVDHNIDDFHPPYTEDTFKGGPSPADLLTPTHIDALTSCLASIHGVFDTFLTFDLESVRRLPIFFHVRTSYAVVCLIKMYFKAFAQNSELGKVIGKEDMKVEFYLNKLLERFGAAAEEDKCRPAAKFVGVLVMLRTWFHKQEYGCGRKVGKAKTGMHPCPRAGFAGTSDSPRRKLIPETRENTPNNAAAPSSRSSSAYPQILSDGVEAHAARGEGNHVPSEYSNANTPLQLLSEVAMGNSNGLSDGIGSSTLGSSQGPSNGWYGYSNGANGDVPATQTSSSSYGTTNGGAPVPMDSLTNEQTQAIPAPTAPGLDMGFDDSMGGMGGFLGGQPMNMTIGDGDFSSIFMDDVFFNLDLDADPTSWEHFP